VPIHFIEETLPDRGAARSSCQGAVPPVANRRLGVAREMAFVL
jgi:hypothetical protein